VKAGGKQWLCLPDGLEFPKLLQPEESLPCSQDPIINPYNEPYELIL
jgi:hypothetical protein